MKGLKNKERLAITPEEKEILASEKETLKHLVRLWNEEYKSRFGLEYRISKNESWRLRALITDYGKDIAEGVIKYYIRNHDSIDYIKAYPSIGALVGFRKQLVAEFVFGRKTLQNQYNGNVEKSLPSVWR